MKMMEDDCTSQNGSGADVEANTGSFNQIIVSYKRNQMIAALTATMGGFITGLMLGWSSPAIPNMNDRQDFGVLTGQDKSWIGSIANVGASFSGFVAGYFIERFGRKKAMILLGIPSIGGYILLASSQNITMVLIGRVITGFAGACFTLVVPVYISEVVEDSMRGLLGTLFVTVLTSGILFTFVLGTFVSWIWLSIVCAMVPVIMMACVVFIPETPRYLLAKGQASDAILSLKWLRNTTDELDVEDEWKRLQKSVREDSLRTAGFRDLFQPSILKPLLISMALMFFQQFGGINAVMFYSVDIFKDSGSEINPNLSSIILASVQIIFVGVSAVLADRAGRRFLFILSDTGMAISLGALGIFFYLKAQNNGAVPDNLSWLPLVSLIAYIITYNFFLGGGPWLMMSELIPSRAKGSASAIVTSFCWILSFIVTKTFEDLVFLIDTYGCYWLFAGVSALGVLFGFLFLPETKGKSLAEIERLFS